MSMQKVYRSLLIAGFSAAALLTAACADADKKHQTLKVEMRERWTATTMAVKLQLAQQQYAVGEYDKCRQTINEALASGRPLPGIVLLAGKVDIEKGSLDTAAEFLKQASELAPMDPEPYYLLGVVYQRWQKFEVALEYYSQAWDRKPADARMMLAVVEMKITLGALDDAQQILQDKMQQFEQTAAVRLAMARIASLKGNHLEASRHYRDAFILLPEDQAVKLSYAESLFFAGKYSEAATMLDDLRTQMRRAEAGEPTETQTASRITLTQMLGQAYLNLRRPIDARNCFQEVLRYQPDNGQAIIGLGKVCIETNDLAAAIAAGKRVLRTEPRNVQAIILVAMAQQKQKKWEDALTTLQSASSIAPKDSTILCMTGISQIKLGRTADAVGSFERAVAANPRDAWATDLLVQYKPVAAGASDQPTLGIDDPAGTGLGIITNAQPTDVPLNDR